LFGASFVDTAFSGVWIEENAIAIGVFHKAFSCTDGAYEFSLEAIEVVLKTGRIGDGLDFLFVE